MTLLAIDPGRSKLLPTIGYCLFTDDGLEIHRGSKTWAELCEDLRLETVEDHKFCEDDCSDFDLTFCGIYISEVVIENFVNDPGTRRGGQTNGASEVIGAVELACAWAKVPFTRQSRTVLPVAKQHAQYVDTHKHLPHQDAAYLHGFEYLIGTGVLTPKGLSSTL